jgi:threonine/homoserine/homoserine lactone efflux protein
VDTQLVVFAGVSLLLAVTPGPDMAVVTRNALAHGQRGVLLTTTGIAIALSVWVTATAFGLAAVLRTSSELLFALKIVGATYLAYLGVKTLIELRHRPGDPPATEAPPAPAHSIFRQGFISAISNPKLGVFFVTFLPQFVSPGQALLPRLLELGLLFALIGWTWMNLYGFLVARVRDLIITPRVRQWMAGVTGVVLLGFGGRLALERV